MANEAVPIELLGDNAAGEQLRFSCANATAIPQGTIVVLSNADRTGIASSASQQIFLGVAAIDKVAKDNSEVSVWTKGIFSFSASGAITRGDRVQTAAGANYVMTSTLTDPAKIVGIALNTASSDKVAVAVGVY